LVQEEGEGAGEEDPGRDFEREEPRCRDSDPNVWSEAVIGIVVLTPTGIGI